MNKFIILQGIQGSGKSTHAKSWVNEDPTKRIRINNDDIRNMLGPYWIPKREDLVKRIKIQNIKIAMSLGYDIIIDNMNLNQKEIDLLEQLVDWYNKENPEKPYDISFKLINTPLEECIRRDALRPNPVSAKVIKDTS